MALLQGLAGGDVSTDLHGGIRSFFEPKSIAVAGVSTDPTKLASIIFANLYRNADNGILNASLYALNPAHDRIGERRCYPTVGSLPEVPDLLIIAVPVSLTLQLVREAALAGVKAVVIVASGFAEAGRKNLETEMRELTKSHRMRVLGPNTIGILDTYSGVDSLFLRSTKTLPSGKEIMALLKPLKGGVVIVTQSGHLGDIVSEEFAARGVGIRALVGTGNQLDVSIEDIIGYFADDKHTKVIAVYIEGISDGRRFMRVASAASKKKPIVVFKTGKTDAGARAALTHTASMVGDYRFYQAAFRQARLLEAEDIQELVDYCVVLSLLPHRLGKRLVIITNAGGVGAIAADEAERVGLKVKPLPKAIVGRIREMFDDSSFISNAALGNPLDLTASVTADEFVRVTKFALSSSLFDIALLLPSHQAPAMDFDISTRLAEVVPKTRTPTCMVVMGESDLSNMIKRDFAEKGIPSFPAPERAVRALAAVSCYGDLRPRGSGPGLPRRKDRFRFPKLQGPLAASAVKTLLGRYGITEPRFAIVRSTKDLPKADRISLPVACKLLSRQLIHKTDAGAVILDVGSRRELASALSRLKELAAERSMEFDGMLVQEMVGKGFEVILGGMRDRTFGPIILFGVGGSYTELIRDYAVAVAPISPAEARELIARTRLSPILSGYRGGQAVDLGVLCGAVSRFSKIMVENPSIDQMEINPMIVAGKRMAAVDARVVTKRRTEFDTAA